MSVKDWIIKKMSRELMIAEKVIGTVVTHQFDSANHALKNNNSVEFYNFGKFVFNEKKAQTQLDKCLSQKKVFEKIINDESSSEEKRRNANLKLEDVLNNIDVLKPKLNRNDI